MHWNTLVANRKIQWKILKMRFSIMILTLSIFFLVVWKIPLQLNLFEWISYFWNGYFCHFSFAFDSLSAFQHPIIQMGMHFVKHGFVSYEFPRCGGNMCFNTAVNICFRTVLSFSLAHLFYTGRIKGFINICIETSLLFAFTLFDLLKLSIFFMHIDFFLMNALKLKIKDTNLLCHFFLDNFQLKIIIELNSQINSNEMDFWLSIL